MRAEPTRRRRQGLLVATLVFALAGPGCAMILGDDFVVDSEEETNGSGGSTTSSSTCDSLDCNGCGTCACSNELLDCNATPDCVSLLDCYGNPCGDGSCPSCTDVADPTPCYEACDAQWPGGVAAEEAALQCYIDKCPTAC